MGIMHDAAEKAFNGTIVNNFFRLSAFEIYKPVSHVFMAIDPNALVLLFSMSSSTTQPALTHTLCMCAHSQRRPVALRHCFLRVHGWHMCHHWHGGHQHAQARGLRGCTRRTYRGCQGPAQLPQRDYRADARGELGLRGALHRALRDAVPVRAVFRDDAGPRAARAADDARGKGSNVHQD